MGNTESSRQKKELKGLLLQAIQSGNLQAVKDIVHHSPHLIKSKLDLGYNTVHITVLYSKSDILSYLLTGSFLSGQKGETAFLEYAINKMGSRDGMTPLMLACDIGDEQVVRLLLDAGADFWFRDLENNRTCLHYAAAKGHVALIPMLVYHSQVWDEATSKFHRTSSLPLIEVSTWQGFTPLMYAVWCDHPETTLALLQLGARVDKRTPGSGFSSDPYCRGPDKGSSAIHMAAFNGSMASTAAILIDYVRRKNDYLLHLGEMRAAQARGESPPTRRRIRPKDPRLALDCAGRTPFVVARNQGHMRLLNLLNPFSALLNALDDLEQPIGVPTLKKLAAKASQQVLLRQIELLVEAASKLKGSQSRNAKRGQRLKSQLSVEEHGILESMLQASPSAALSSHCGTGLVSSRVSNVEMPMETIFERASAAVVSSTVAASKAKNVATSGIETADAPALKHVSVGSADQMKQKPSGDLPLNNAGEAARSGIKEPGPHSPRQATGPHSPRQAGSYPSLRSVVPWRNSSRFAVPEAAMDVLNASADEPWPLDSIPTDLPDTVSQQFSVDLLPHSQTELDSHFCTSLQKAHDFKGVADASSPVAISKTGSHAHAQLGEKAESKSLGPSDRTLLRQSLEMPSNTERLMDEKEEGLYKFTQGLMHTSALDPNLTMVLSTASFTGSPVSGARVPSSSSQVQQSALSSSIQALEKQMRDAMSSLVENVDDNHIEHTLTAARYHRLIHGVQSPFNNTGWSSLANEAAEHVGTSRLPSPDVSVHNAHAGKINVHSSPDVSVHNSNPGRRLAEPGGETLVKGTKSILDSAPSLSHQSLSHRVSTSFADEDEYEATCGVCLEEGFFVAMQPCNHKICADCAKELIKLHPSDPAPCPFCRGFLRGFKVYLRA
ncbi:hypothetical protein CEUSTIGMA_g245.t1 [Chlamydomonas eustigma]|uniref:RING-type domain-containing protein n=1 Tax=Chlamydomonas eustigma TaxID=1157962 RepID=A0A250WQG6_9CHLO|nr:hypothetical protein CEUSTIGMA_g245.t1 [Chlamydomonas eustigma]|eukprot:GAX72790.1 hypothetical protein CEUSTIGMA_g245.t1 [Chlamydomonas eustigma]